MAEVEGCDTIRRAKVKKQSRGTTTRRRFSPMQAGRGETIYKERRWVDPLEQGQRRGSNKY